MEKKFKLGMIIALYLSKYDQKAVDRLGYKSRREAFREVGKKLDVNHFTIKHMRDQFDTIYSHRAGYHQVSLPPSRAEVAEKYSELSELAFYEIVKDILSESNDKDDIESYVNVLDLSEEKDEINKKRKNRGTIEYTSRGITGVRAEEFFKEQFYKGKLSEFSNGELVDTRQDGSGYDFKLIGEPEVYFEIKGLTAQKGGVLFTDKEWAVAKEKQDQYILVFITNLNQEPQIELIKNPYQKLKPQKNISTTITVNWSVDATQFKQE
ncbi:DUF3883 domain-containing protein [Bacillus sp. CFBP9009]